jgi:ABC-type xylose transport system permease subunit
VRKISPPPGFDPRTVLPVASRYTYYGIPTRKEKQIYEIIIIIIIIIIICVFFSEENIGTVLCSANANNGVRPCSQTLVLHDV